MIIFENEDLLKVEADMSVIPAYTLTFSENALYVAEAIERDFNEMIKNIGINELAVYESTGMQIVYEGEKLTSFKESVVKFFQEMWKKIKAAFEAVMEKFQSLTKKVNKMIPNISGSDIDKLDDDKTFGKTHKFADIIHESYGINADDYAKEVSDEFKKLSKKEDLTKEEISSKKEELEKDICSKVSDIKNVTTVSEMTTEMGKVLLGEEVVVDKKFIKANLNEIRGIVAQGSTVKQIKELYKQSRAFIDRRISEVKKYTDERAKTMNAEVSVLKSIGQTMNSANGKALDVSKRRFTEYRNILVRVAIALGKITQEEKSEVVATGESVVAKQLDLIESAFDF